jgi:hypothetical protein
MAARQALNLCEAELLTPLLDKADILQSSAGTWRGPPRVSVAAARAALRAAGAPPYIAAALRGRLRLITDQEAKR